MKMIKINSKVVKSGAIQDKTDWSKVYGKPQAVVDREAMQDIENPILDKSKFKRVNKN